VVGNWAIGRPRRAESAGSGHRSPEEGVALVEPPQAPHRAFLDRSGIAAALAKLGGSETPAAQRKHAMAGLGGKHHYACRGRGIAAAGQEGRGRCERAFSLPGCRVASVGPPRGHYGAIPSSCSCSARRRASISSKVACFLPWTGLVMGNRLK